MRPIGALLMRNSTAPVAWTPSSLSVAPKHWFDAQDSGTITQSGGTVSQWNDKGSGAANATQATGANQPAYVASSNLNSLPALRNTAANNKEMTYTSAVTALETVNFAGATNQIAVTIETVTFTSGVVFTKLTTPSILGVIWTAGAGTGTVTFFESGTQKSQSTGATLTTSGAFFCMANSATAGQSSFGRFLTSAKLFNGAAGNRAAAADFGEIIVLNYAPTSTEREKIEGYMMWRWGAQADLPVGHPYASAAP